MKHQKTVEQEVINFIKRHQLISDKCRLLIGLSGGADSVFAVHFFNKYKRKYNLNICAVHINHNLRDDESLRDAQFCSDLCETIDVDFYSADVNVKEFAKKNKNSIEEAARVLRYKKFEEIRKKTKSDLIVTAHNNDDNTETVLLNIVSGAGIEGISGIPVKRENIIRPFLCLSKGQIINYLTENKIKFVEDSTNEDLSYRRNFIRKEIVPLLSKLNPSLNKVILSSSEVFSNQKKVLNYFVNEVFSKVVKVKNDIIKINIAELNNYPDEIFGEILKMIFQNYLKSDFSHNQFTKINSLMESQTGTIVEISKKYSAIKERNHIRIFDNSENIPDSISVGLNSKTQIGNKILTINLLKQIPKSTNKQNNVEILSADKIESELTLRKWEIGDKFQPFGMKGTKNVSDVLTDAKISAYEKSRQLVLTNKNDIIYLVGLRISEKYKIDSQTNRAIKIRIK